MKKVSYLAFCLLLVAGFGCAITNYGIITDNDQVSNGQGSGVVDTKGKAKLFESSQIATIWPDGTDELFSMIDQKADVWPTICRPLPDYLPIADRAFWEIFGGHFLAISRLTIFCR